jgi:Maltose acetyltransferase
VTGLEDGRSQRERMLVGDLYLPGDPELVEHKARAARLLDAFNGCSAARIDERRAFSRSSSVHSDRGARSAGRRPILASLTHEIRG